MPYTIDLSGRTALVTGASRGIGRAVLDGLAAAGARVFAVARGAAALAEAVGEVRAAGGAAESCPGDVTDPAFVEALAAQLAEAGGPDVLVNNAGITRDNLVLRLSDEDWQTVLDTNLTAAFRLCRTFARAMMKKRGGRIIMIASVAGLMGNAGQANYAAAKGGLIAFSKSLARELAGRTITVNVVCPGFTATEMTAALPEPVRRAAAESVLLKRFAAPAEIAAGVVFLAAPQASYLTGAVLTIDGGLRL